MDERISVNSLCFGGAGLEDLASAWQALRPHRVSFTSDLVCSDPAAAAELVRGGGYRVETIWHPFVDDHLDCNRARLEAGCADLLRLLEVAQLLGARSIYLTTGGHGALTWEEAADRFVTAIEPCVPRASEVAVDLLIENAPPLRADRPYRPLPARHDDTGRTGRHRRVPGCERLLVRGRPQRPDQRSDASLPAGSAE